MEPDTPADDVGRITQEGFVIGTPDFLAPEQARNPMAVDIRADIYSLGGTLFYILTGKVPYDGVNATEKLLKHCTEPPPQLLRYRPDAPPQLDQIIQWCMAKQIEIRPQTPLELALAIQPFCPLPQPAFLGPSSGQFQVLGGGVPSGQHPVAPLQGVPGGQYPLPAGNAVVAGSGLHPLPAAYPSPAQHGYHYPMPPGYPVPVPGYPPGFPMPLQEDPNRSSQVFKLPPQTTAEDPIRKRGESGFPWSTLLLGLCSLLAIGFLGYGMYVAFKRPSELPLETFTNSQGIKMVKLDGGKFRMGSSENDPLHRVEELPQHDVTIKGPFFMAATEVSHAQFLKVMSFSHSKSAEKAARAQNLPAEYVTWDEANDFCKKLTESEKEQKWMRKGWTYRLPTEAEWEYAARAGTETPFAFGERIEYEKQALFRPLENDLIGMGGGARKPDFPQEVGKTEANGFGLHDMHGNVAEWCLDWYKSGYPTDAPQDNPTGPSSGDRRVVRGGSFKDTAKGVRSASRAGIRASERNDYVGFRIVYAPLQK
jgi:formylglycine-generating enzyme required for sulfatase activity